MRFGRGWQARGRGHCRRGKPGLLDDYAADLSRTEGSSTVDEPGEY